MNLTHTLAVIAIAGGVTFALRATPFVFLRQLRDNDTVKRLGAIMPLGVLAILVVYTLRDVTWTSLSALPVVAGCVVTAALHLWRHNALLSLVAGVAAYGIGLYLLA